jgi:hypothetical protein
MVNCNLEKPVVNAFIIVVYGYLFFNNNNVSLLSSLFVEVMLTISIYDAPRD